MAVEVCYECEEARALSQCGKCGYWFCPVCFASHDCLDHMPDSAAQEDSWTQPFSTSLTPRLKPTEQSLRPIKPNPIGPICSDASSVLWPTLGRLPIVSSPPSAIVGKESIAECPPSCRAGYHEPGDFVTQLSRTENIGAQPTACQPFQSSSFINCSANPNSGYGEVAGP